MTKTRPEKDALGVVEVPAFAYWGAATERARHFFAIGEEKMPARIIRALALIKLAAARVNGKAGRLPKDIAQAIETAASRIAAGELPEQFPLSLWQTGSGTQSNMNVNEVIAGLANENLTGQRGGKSPVHPNDHVNLGQSSNDSFPTALHLAALAELKENTQPALVQLCGALEEKAKAFHSLIKLGRTHMMDAVPLRLGQEFGAYGAQVKAALDRIATATDGLLELAQGGTAVGTGLNAPAGFAVDMARELSALTGEDLKPAANIFAALAAHDALLALSGALSGAAAALSKIAFDLRLMASGPRAGLGELTLPANEPGSSIMPGKVNPTQIEALTQVAAQVIGNHTTVTLAGAYGGQLELNVMKPLIGYGVLQSARLLGDAVRSFTQHCVLGLEANEARLKELLGRSLMLVTALAPRLGYDQAAALALKAWREGKTLREVVAEEGALDLDEFDRLTAPEGMIP